MLIRLSACLFACLLVVFQSSCALTPSPEISIVRGLLKPEGSVVSSAHLDPKLRYLRVEVNGHPPSLLVLGYVDSDTNGPIEVWYSASQEVLKLQNGRIIATGGLPVDWSNTHFDPAPIAWSELKVSAIPADGMRYQRIHDESRHYRTGIAEIIQLQPWVGELSKSILEVLPSTLAPELAAQYVWYRESASRIPLRQTATATDSTQLPSAWYALSRKERGGQGVVEFSYQCLSSTFCLKLQRWPVQENVL